MVAWQWSSCLLQLNAQYLAPTLHPSIVHRARFDRVSCLERV